MANRRIPKTSPVRAQPEPSDLVDFYLRWRDFRPTAEAMTSKPELSAEQRLVARWLMTVMDRISLRDLQ